VPVCSPWHTLVNGSFIAFGTLLALGAALVGRALARGPAASTATVAWVVAGLSSITTGLVPIDQNLGLHALVSLPVLFAQPLAVLATAHVAEHRSRHLARTGVVVGLGCLALAGAVVALPSGEYGGLLERLAIWPCLFWLALLATAAFRGSIPGGRHP
jgi:hypothetical protein